MAAPELHFLELERFLQKRDGLIQALGTPVNRRQAPHSSESLGVAGAQPRPHESERLLVQRDRLIRSAAILIGAGQGGHASERVGVVGSNLAV